MASPIERLGLALALIVAAGRGERLGASIPKALAELGGRTLLRRSVDLMLASESVDRVLVALPPGVDLAAALVSTDGAGALDRTRDLVGCAPGGSVRSESVANALAAAGPGAEDELVVVHDAARPLATPALVRRTLDALVSDVSLAGAIAATPVTDTIKRAQDGAVVQTLDRSELWAVQTPQAFRRGSLRRALDVTPEVLVAATDDAWLIERMGGRVAIVPAGPENIKITTPLDLALAELLLTAGSAGTDAEAAD